MLGNIQSTTEEKAVRKLLYANQRASSSELPDLRSEPICRVVLAKYLVRVAAPLRIWRASLKV
jgi:hypothetical protein